MTLFLCCAALGQNEETLVRELQGVVTDASGVIVEGAAVKLKDTKSLQIQSFITDAKGQYHFANLSPDIEYQVRADHEGATSGWKTLSPFSSKKVTTINLKLRRESH